MGLSEQLDALKKSGSLPKHVAVIMDGNGRWAKKRLLPRTAGHKMGLSRVRDLVTISNDLEIKSLTLYAFSTENWSRPKLEVNFLFRLLSSAMAREVNILNQHNVQMKFIGNRDNLPDFVIKAIDRAENTTAQNTGLILNIAFNYGGRWDILNATQHLIQDVLEQKIPYSKDLKDPKNHNITEDLFKNYLSLSQDIDLVIRTSGEHRISNFLLWQISYAELYFTDIHFPAFDREAYCKALVYYAQKERRQGKISEQLIKIK